MSTTFIIILLIAIVMAVIGISMNRSRTGRGRQRHGSASDAVNSSKQQSGGDRSRDASDGRDGK